METLDIVLFNFWQTLNRNEVRYIMVGEYALLLAGCKAVSDSPGIIIKDTPINRQRVRKSFIDLGYGDQRDIETMDFTIKWTVFDLGDGILLDIMTSMKGLEHKSFDECYQQARWADLEGVQVPFLHINDLIANKKAVFRPKDQIDLIELERIKKIMDEQANQKNP